MSQGMRVAIGEVKARKGIIRTKISCKREEWAVEITGDFLIYPEDLIYELERRLSGPRQTLEKYLEKINETLSSAEFFGCAAGDFMESFKVAYMEAEKVCSEYC